MIKLLDNIKDISEADVKEGDGGGELGDGPFEVRLNDTWWSIPKELKSGSRTFVPIKLLGEGGFGVVFGYKEKKKLKEPPTPSNSFALKLVNGKNVQDVGCLGTLEYFPKIQNASQICQGIIYQRCITPTGLWLPPIRGSMNKNRLSFFMVMELMDGDILDLTAKRLSPDAKKKIVLETKEALMCLLDHKRYYADLHAANIFFTYSKKYKGRGIIRAQDLQTIKLGDLGGVCKKGETKLAKWHPPSAWNKGRGKKSWEAPCSEATMVWQLAVVVYHLYTNRGITAGAGMPKGITPRTFPGLPLEQFKKVFRKTNMNKNQVSLKDLF